MGAGGGDGSSDLELLPVSKDSAPWANVSMKFVVEELVDEVDCPSVSDGSSGASDWVGGVDWEARVSATARSTRKACTEADMGEEACIHSLFLGEVGTSTHWA